MTDKSNQESITSASTKEEVVKQVKKGELEMDEDLPILGNRYVKILSWLNSGLSNPRKNIMYKTIKSKAMRETLHEAIEKGDISTQNYFTGLKGYERDLSGAKTIRKLLDIFSSPGGRIAITYGNMGTGKTDFNIFLVEWLLLGDIAKVATNIESLASNMPDKFVYIEDFEEMEEVIRETDGRVIILIDEASSNMTGQSNHAYAVVDKFKGLVPKLRKNNSNMLIIGHTGKDIHPLFRRLAVWIEKLNKREAKVFRTVQTDGDAKAEGEDKLLHLQNIETTNYPYDTDEESTFSLNFDEDEEKYSEKDLERIVNERLDEAKREQRNSLIRKSYKHTDMTQEDLSVVFDLSKSTINDILN